MTYTDELLKSKQSLEAAERAFERLKFSTRFEDIDDYWVAILYNLAIVVKTLAPLEESDVSLAPVLRKMQEDRRGSDPLITYVYEARNTKDHGLAPIVAYQSGSTIISSTSPDLRIDRVKIGGIVFHNTHSVNTPIPFLVVNEGPEPTEVELHGVQVQSGGVSIHRNLARVKLVDVEIKVEDRARRRGKKKYYRYVPIPVPNSHKDVNIESDIQNFAGLALVYYWEKFNEILKILNLNTDLQPI